MIMVWMRRFWKCFMVVGFGDELQSVSIVFSIHGV